MHPADVLVIGPLEPLLSHPLRVRLPVAAACAVALGCAGLMAALLVALETGLLPVSVPAALAGILPASRPVHEPAAIVPVRVTSSPTGARILLGDRELGTTPAAVNVGQGGLLVLRREGFLDAFVRPSGPSLEVLLWRSQPEVRLVRPPVPGAAIRSADFLPNGRVALAIEIPPTGERQPWAYDPVGGRLDRLGRAAAPGALPSAVAIAPDGIHMAALLHLDGLDGGPADQLAFDGPDGPRQPLSPTGVGERLLDISWSPKGDGVLLLSQRRAAGGTHFLIRWVGIDGDTRDLAGEPVPGSWAWAPDGHASAFLVHASTTALVTLDVASGELRYLDDLRPDGLPGSGALAPATWEPSGGLLYAAPAGGRGFPNSSTTSAPVLFEVAPGRVDAHRVGDVEPVWAPIMRPDGVLLTLARDQNDVLVLRPVSPSGHAVAEQRLDVQVSGAYAARWDLGHQQLLIVRGAAGGLVEVLLLRFGAEDPSPGSRSNSTTPEASR
jgi:PEGA domain